MDRLPANGGGKRAFFIVLAAFAAVFVILYHKLLWGSEIFTHDSYIWLGSFYYFVDSLAAGSYPLWDPYSLAGTDFYPSIHTHGLLDPLIFVSVFMVKSLGATILRSFVYFYLLRLLVFAFGAYYLYKRASGTRLAALVAAGVLALAVAPTAFRQMGILENVFLTPFALYFLIKVFDNPGNLRKFGYLALFAVAAGISVNVFIPAYFAFNLVVYIVVLFVLGIVRLSRLERIAGDRPFLAYIALIIILLVFMAAPTFQLFRESRSPDGEHFPSVRIVQKNDGMFKQMVASDLPDDVLSEKFTDSKGVYSSAGNIISFIYPDVFLFYMHDTGGFKRADTRWGDFISEAFQYVGIFSILAAIIGLIWSKSRWRLLALIMLAVISVNMLSTYGVHSRPPNGLQIIFNRIFPLLGMMEVRETLSGFSLLYVCLLMALGLRIFLDGEAMRDFMDTRFTGVVVVCAAVVFVKLVVTLYLFKSAVYISTVDMIALAGIAGFCALIYLGRRRVIGPAALMAVIIAVIIVDIFYYNHVMRRFVLQPNTLEDELAATAGSRQDAVFELYRIPFINYEGKLPLAFSEAVFRKKGAMSRANNHHFLTTKRFYDYFTNVPLANQAAASGLTAPIIRFYPDADVWTFPTRRDALEYLSKAPEGDVERRLILESGSAAPVVKGGAGFDIKRLPDATWLKPDEIIRFYKTYIAQHGGEGARERDGALKTADYEIVVNGFTPNTVEVSVKNNVAGYLYYSDGWSRWWKAYDNGNEVRVVPADYNFKAVRLDKGSHSVRFVFDPSGYRHALYLYYSGLAATAGLIIVFAFVGRAKMY